MAPQTVIETVTISRPIKVIAFLCGIFACVLLLMAFASSEWVISDNYKQGLLAYCVLANKTDPIPFVEIGDTEAEAVGCHWIDLSQQAYTLICGGFCLSSLLISIFATLLTVLGLRCRDANKKYKYYRLSTIVMTVALVGALVALVVYPVCFTSVVSTTLRREYEFGWAMGVGWGAAIFLFGGIILLLCDRESEEIYYKERTIVQYADPEDKN